MEMGQDQRFGEQYFQGHQRPVHCGHHSLGKPNRHSSEVDLSHEVAWGNELIKIGIISYLVSTEEMMLYLDNFRNRAVVMLLEQ